MYFGASAESSNASRRRRMAALMLLSNSTIVPFGQSFWCNSWRVTTSPELWTSIVKTLMDWSGSLIFAPFRRSSATRTSSWNGPKRMKRAGCAMPMESTLGAKV
jgi:hypothetical protein